MINFIINFGAIMISKFESNMSDVDIKNVAMSYKKQTVCYTSGSE